MFYELTICSHPFIKFLRGALDDRLVAPKAMHAMQLRLALRVAEHT